LPREEGAHLGLAEGPVLPNPHVVEAAGDPSLAERTWVLLTEAPDGGWGLAGHANTNEELIAAARAQIAELQAKKPNDST